MKCKFFVVAIACFVKTTTCFSQNTKEYKWWNPTNNSFPVIEGQAWPNEVKERYDRFPARAEKTLNPNVWNISHSSAGLYIKFKTDASDIVVRYVVQSKGSFAMNHMPATGVSGIDLYAIDHNGKWVWAQGRFSFGDTIEYRFSNLEVDPVFSGRDCEYRLFLPLYNAVQWLQVGVPGAKNFAPIPLSAEKPIVVYGTSIAQGACATRPGLAWTAILERNLDRPLINLGFSGSGQLEKSVIDLMTEIDAKLYILDCLPNLTNGAGFADDEVKKRIRESVNLLQQKHPSIPILLVEHSSGNTLSIIDTAKHNEYKKVNNALRKIFAQLKNEGIQNISLLGNKDINLDIDATVDGLHPNDIGMMKYAAAYEKIIRNILHEPSGNISSTIPVIQSRDGYYDWRSRHAEILQLNKADPPKSVILGNSIIHYWGGEPKASLTRGADTWNKHLLPLDMRNLGFGWDKIENVLWRVYHEELDGFDAANVVLMIGTNNLTENNDEEIIVGLKNLVGQIKIRQPKATVLLAGILPRRQMEKRIIVLNKGIARLSTLLHIKYINPGTVLLNKTGNINESLFEDGLHPNAAGYEKLGAQLASYLK
ncbi:SGNH/GDSL hydrolase family protein [Terrimonas pollutisoli]|uniref:SGNH/GDSL hydrolase family protein n=1 Tax=Terrimonas pollutisoli TaxID=3034147 RepID=UPI0023EAC175|nr:SGNH/GDSL hydrolase family protein [Terrimonas sp. H1YJ31]